MPPRPTLSLILAALLVGMLLAGCQPGNPWDGRWDAGYTAQEDR